MSAPNRVVPCPIKLIMKLKCQPEDFRVEELSAARASDSGQYTLYRLSKRDIGTIEAVQAIRRRWNIAGHRVSYAGLKDRHAETVQYLTIAGGPSAAMVTPRFRLEPVGRTGAPYGPRELLGNRFELVLRDLSEADAATALEEIDDVSRVGLPNYFDDQRFGSLGVSGDFVAHAWLAGDHERALELAMAEPNPSDRAPARTEKAILRAHWRDWPEAKRKLPRSSARSIVTYLVDHPADFRGAFARLPRELRMLYFSAFQSHLWNLVLAGWLRAHAAPDELAAVELKAGTFLFPRRMGAERVDALRRLSLPLPCARTALPEGLLGTIVAEVLAPHGLAWNDLRIKHIKDIFLSKGARPALFAPAGVRAAPEDDTLYPGRRALRLAFELPKGSYATILVKRITDAAEERA